MFRKIFGLLLISGLLLIVSGSLFAQQNAQELRFGSIVSGNLRSNEEIWYSIRATETCLLAVETTGSTDTYLEIYNSQRSLIIEDDDGGNDGNARVEILAASGNSYLVKLRGYSDSSGPFRIMAGFTPISEVTELRPGAVLSGSITSGQRKLYSVRTAEAGLYTVETSGNTDTYLDAYDSSYMYIGYNDDGDNDYNAQLEIIAEANKTYYFVLRGYENDTSGSYRIWVSFESIDIGSTNNTNRSTAAVLNLGEAIPVSITATHQSRWFVYELTRSGIVTFVVQTRGRMDTRLYLYDKSGSLLEEDDDSGDDYNALISTRLNSGTYYIEVKGYGDEIGRCTIHAEIR